MDHRHRTTNPHDEADLPSIQSISVQHPNRVLIHSTQSPDPQEYSRYLNNRNDQINNSGLINASSLIVNINDVYHTNTSEEQSNFQHEKSRDEFDITKSKQIQIKCQPRSTYHPRTLTEAKKVAHYLRCDDGEGADHPTIYLIPSWNNESKTNYIEVTLVDVKNQGHPYVIENKERNSSEGQQLIYRIDNAGLNTLYFLLTDDDFGNGFKSFKIELIKSKQGNGITKNLIRERELEKSMLRFTRTFYDEMRIYHRDEASTVYSCVMTEKYGDVGVQHVNPEFGPIGGNQLLDIVLTGLKAKDKEKLSFEIYEQTTGWVHKIKNFETTGNTIHFLTPAFAHPQNGSVMTSVIVYFEGEVIHESPYLYDTRIDPILNDFNLSKSIPPDASPTTSNNCNDFNQNITDNLCSSSIVPKQASKTRKRKYEK